MFYRGVLRLFIHASLYYLTFFLFLFNLGVLGLMVSFLVAIVTWVTSGRILETKWLKNFAGGDKR